MLENILGSNFCVIALSVKNLERTRPIYIPFTVNRPRDTIPTQISHRSQWKVQTGSEVKNKKASTEFRVRSIIIAEQLCHEGR